EGSNPLCSNEDDPPFVGPAYGRRPGPSQRSGHNNLDHRVLPVEPADRIGHNHGARKLSGTGGEEESLYDRLPFLRNPLPKPSLEPLPWPARFLQPWANGRCFQYKPSVFSSSYISP